MKYSVVKRDSFTVIGRRCVTPTGGGAWGVGREDGTVARMEEMDTGMPFLGICFGFHEDGSNDNMVGMEYSSDIPEGMDHFVFPECQWLVVEASGKISDNIVGNTWNEIYEKMIPEIGCTKAELPTIENYIEWNDEKNHCEMEIRIPILTE